MTNTYKTGDTVLLTDTEEIGEVAKIINIASDSYELEFQDGECGWYAHHEFELIEVQTYAGIAAAMAAQWGQQ